MRFFFAAALIIIPTTAMAQTYCRDGCKRTLDRERNGCMSYFSDQNRYTACLSDADRNYQRCLGSCK